VLRSSLFGKVQRGLRFVDRVGVFGFPAPNPTPLRRCCGLFPGPPLDGVRPRRRSSAILSVELAKCGIQPSGTTPRIDQILGQLVTTSLAEEPVLLGVNNRRIVEQPLDLHPNASADLGVDLLTGPVRLQ
jgi:hypothetical protein